MAKKGHSEMFVWKNRNCLTRIQVPQISNQIDAADCYGALQDC